MVTTFGELQQRILYETNKTAQDFSYGVQNAIRTAIIYLEAQHPWLFTKTAVVTVLADTNATNLPSDFNQIANVVYYRYGDMYNQANGFVQMSYSDLQNLYGGTSNGGLPLKFAIWGEQLHIYPITLSDQEFVITYYYKDENLPQNDNDISIWFNDETIDALRNKALEIFYRDTLQSAEIADTYVQIYLDYIRNLQTRNNRKAMFNRISV